MDNIYATLVLVTFVFLIVGIFSPRKSLFWDKKAPTRKKSALIYGGGLFLFLVLLGSTVDPNKATASTSESPTEVVAEKPLTEADKKRITAESEARYKAQAEEEAKARAAETVSADQLKELYADNEVKADKIFKGNKFYVTGTITEISKDIMDNIYVTLNGDESLRGVKCYFDNEDIAADFKKGQQVTFQGRGDGYLILDVIMKDCTLVTD